MEMDELRNLKTGPKWRKIRVRQELVEQVKREIERKKSRYPSLSEFVSEAIQLRLTALAEEERIGEPFAFGLGARGEGQIWNMIAEYNRNMKECECKQEEITTILANLPAPSLACSLTGIQCSLHTCPRANI